MLAKEIAFIERFKAREPRRAGAEPGEEAGEDRSQVEPPKRRQTVDVRFPPAPRSGGRRDASRAKKGYGERRASTTASTSRPSPERWCVMGVNSASKSTLPQMVSAGGPDDDGSA